VGSAIPGLCSGVFVHHYWHISHKLATAQYLAYLSMIDSKRKD